MPANRGPEAAAGLRGEQRGEKPWPIKRGCASPVRHSRRHPAPSSTQQQHQQQHEARRVLPRPRAGRRVAGGGGAQGPRGPEAPADQAEPRPGPGVGAGRRRQQPRVPQPVSQLRQLHHGERVRVRRHGLPPRLQFRLPRLGALLLQRPVLQELADRLVRQRARRHHRVHLHGRRGGPGLLPGALLLQQVLRVLPRRGLRLQLPRQPGVRPGERQLRASGQEPQQLQQLQLRRQRGPLPALLAGPVRLRVLHQRVQRAGQQVPQGLPHEPRQRLRALQAGLLPRGPHRRRGQQQRLLQLPGAGQRRALAAHAGVLPARHGLQRGQPALRADRLQPLDDIALQGAAEGSQYLES